MYETVLKLTGNCKSNKNKLIFFHLSKKHGYKGMIKKLVLAYVQKTWDLNTLKSPRILHKWNYRTTQQTYMGTGIFCTV